jgi:hypothetical protein
MFLMTRDVVFYYAFGSDVFECDVYGMLYARRYAAHVPTSRQSLFHVFFHIAHIFAIHSHSYIYIFISYKISSKILTYYTNNNIIYIAGF